MIELNSYTDLEEYIKLEFKRQPDDRVVEIKLNSIWFTKLLKLIQFYLQHDKLELDAKKQFDDKLKQFKVKINNRKTRIIRNDI